MGYLSSSSSSKTSVKTGQLSPAGQTYDSEFNQMVQQSLRDNGFQVTPKGTGLSPADQSLADSYQSQIDSITEKIQSMKNKPAAGGVSTYSPTNKVDMAALSKLQGQLADAQKNLANVKSRTFQDYSITEAPDPRVQDAIDKYGADSPQVQNIQSQINDEKVTQAYQKDDIAQSLISNIQKYTNGDMSYTQDQKDTVDQYFAPIRGTINRAANEIIDTAQSGFLTSYEQLQNISLAIDKTGLDTMSAIAAAGVQMDKSNATMMDVLQKATTSANANAQFQFDLMSKQIDIQTAQQAALLGLPPGSMAEKNQALGMKANALTSIQLQLAQNETQQALGIQQGTEQGKINLSLAGIQLAETQGAKQENVQNIGLGLTEMLGQQTMSAQAARGNALIGAQQQEQQTLQNLAYNNLPGRIGTTEQGIAFNTQQQAANLGIQQALMAPISHERDIEEQRSLEETTTKNTTTQTPSIASTLLGGLGVAASAAGAVMGGGYGAGGLFSGGAGQASAPAAAPVFNTQYIPAANATGVAPGTPNYSLGVAGV